MPQRWGGRQSRHGCLKCKGDRHFTVEATASSAEKCSRKPGHATPAQHRCNARAEFRGAAAPLPERKPCAAECTTHVRYATIASGIEVPQHASAQWLTRPSRGGSGTAQDLLLRRSMAKGRRRAQSMPRLDGTGPLGMGPMTGRGDGYCVLRALPDSSREGLAGLLGRPVRVLDRDTSEPRKGVSIMPRGDGTGPAGVGPMTGRGMGRCAGYPAPGYANRAGGRGFRGWPGGRGRGRGRGARNAFFGPPALRRETPRERGKP